MSNGAQRSLRSAGLARTGVREGANILLLVPFQLFGPNDAPRVGREHEEKHFRKDLLEQVGTALALRCQVAQPSVQVRYKCGRDFRRENPYAPPCVGICDTSSLSPNVFRAVASFSLMSARSWRTEDQPLTFARVQLVFRCIFPLDAVQRYFPYGGFCCSEVHASSLKVIV